MVVPRLFCVINSYEMARCILASLFWNIYASAAMKDAINRRKAIVVLASTAALPLVAACNREPANTPAPNATEADALALLDDIGNNLLRLSPETATSLGIDTGARSALRSQLSDRSAQGQ